MSQPVQTTCPALIFSAPPLPSHSGEAQQVGRGRGAPDGALGRPSQLMPSGERCGWGPRHDRLPSAALLPKPTPQLCCCRCCRLRRRRRCNQEEVMTLISDTHRRLPTQCEPSRRHVMPPGPGRALSTKISTCKKAKRPLPPPPGSPPPPPLQALLPSAEMGCLLAGLVRSTFSFARIPVGCIWKTGLGRRQLQAGGIHFGGGVPPPLLVFFLEPGDPPAAASCKRDHASRERMLSPGICSGGLKEAHARFCYTITHTRGLICSISGMEIA
ncbi:uncharacterized protein LOC133371535 [Rhineura floridana]|uniref:uncharacterized protein LOC133371535 n=1 Tax=Rhineura floridana TaxID=261503 RepID=UPI002AC83118|nr:uncharacterized protein LOC133371535 [Rhineura floridana]